MATKKQIQEPNRVRQVSRKVALAYIGAFGVAGDELAKLFERLVERGESMEKRARKMMNQNGKQVRHLTVNFEREPKANSAQAPKSPRKTVKRVEHAAA
jgi:poly(hydroxyalkanoate) granule-associated protein